MATIVFIGSSINWTPALLGDLLHVFREPLEIRFVDLDPGVAELCRQWGEQANRVFGRTDRYRATTDRRAALAGADAVLITLSTGGLEAMAEDLAIPERYGIYATVGDTCGPSGWARAVRNIPVFVEFADDFQVLCPDALIANYTNPMSALTATLQRRCANPVIGLCHAYFETKDVLQQIFELPDWSDLEIEISGINHFTWVTSFRIAGQDGYPALKARLGGRPLDEILPQSSADELGFVSGHRLCSALYQAHGRLVYPADRHTCEFLTSVIAGDPPRSRIQGGNGVDYEVIEPYAIKRTTVKHRHLDRKEARARFDRIFERAAGDPPARSRETGADMIDAYINGHVVTDAVNQINTGQVPDLPLGACVETLGRVSRDGVQALSAKPLPPLVSELIRPAALAQTWVVGGMLTADRDQLYAALAVDAQSRSLRPEQIDRLFGELCVHLGRFAGCSFLR